MNSQAEYAAEIVGGIAGAHAQADRELDRMENQSKRQSELKAVLDKTPAADSTITYMAEYQAADEYSRRQMVLEVRYHARQAGWSYQVDGCRCNRITALDSLRQGRPAFDMRYLLAGVRG